MCGIAGYLSASTPADLDVLTGMVASLTHRGPDEQAGFLDGRMALGHARLSIVDLAGGHQPLVSEDRKVAIAFNGEIFNYLELQERLRQQGERFKSRSEIEVLMHLYLRHGDRLFEMLEGQFAIVIWDGHHERLLLCRDRFGIRPLFWHQDHSAFSFASEIKALAQRPGLNLRFDHRSLLQSFRFWTNVGDVTCFEGVHMLPPGHVLTFDGKTRGVELRRYWEWPLPSTVLPLQLDSDEAYFERFREEMNASVGRQRMADVNVASYLSGGVDSSVVAAVLGRQMELTGGKLRTYSVSFDDPEYDESEAQNVMAHRFGLEHTSLRISTEDIGLNFPEVVWHAEAPLFRTAPVPLFLLSQQVRRDGIKVTMTGEGADEVLLGYDLFRETLIRRFWARNPDSKWRHKLFRKLYHYLPQFRNPRFVELVAQGYRSHLNSPDWHYPMAHRWANGVALQAYFSQNIQDLAERYDPTVDIDAWLPAGYGTGDDISHAQVLEVNTLLSNYLLSSQGDRVSLAHSVEGRYPYLDDRFVAFCATIPRRLKLRGLRDKFILRQAFKNILPGVVATRPKVAYQAPDLRAFFVNGRLMEYAAELLSPRRLSETGLFDPALVAVLIEKGRSSNMSRIGTRDNMAFVLMLSTMLLDDIFVRKASQFVPRQKDLSVLKMV